MASPDGATERLEALDGLRGVMALAVAFYHFGMWASLAPVGTPANTLFAALGLYSVQGFFVLSGLCFYLLYSAAPPRGRGLAEFHIKRFFRIAPLYYLSLGLSLASGLTVGSPPTAALVLENMSFSFGFVHPNHALVAGGWSIGVEYVFYAAFPLWLWLGRRPLGLWLSCVVLAVVAARATLHVREVPPSQAFHAYVAVANHAVLFALGALVAEVRGRLRIQLPDVLLPALIAAIGLAVYVAVEPVPDHFALVTGWARVLGVAACVALACCAALVRGTSMRLGALYRHLGQLSYGVYMLHRLVFVAVAALLPAATPALARCLVALACTMAGARVVYVLVEQPCLRLGKRLAARVRASGSRASAHEGEHGRGLLVPGAGGEHGRGLLVPGAGGHGADSLSEAEAGGQAERGNQECRELGELSARHGVSPSG